MALCVPGSEDMDSWFPESEAVRRGITGDLASPSVPTSFDLELHEKHESEVIQNHVCSTTR